MKGPSTVFSTGLTVGTTLNALLICIVIYLSGFGLRVHNFNKHGTYMLLMTLAL